MVNYPLSSDKINLIDIIDDIEDVRLIETITSADSKLLLTIANKLEICGLINLITIKWAMLLVGKKSFKDIEKTLAKNGVYY